MNAQFKTADDLQEHYWSVIVPMVRKHNAQHGTDVKPWECVRHLDVIFSTHPRFTSSLKHYTFALAILEGKPLFWMGRIYWANGDPFTWKTNGHFLDDLHECNFTWAPPTKKRTFMLNGVELPCPVNTPAMKDGTTVYGLPINLPEDSFWFTSKEDRGLVNSTLLNILTEARDKE